jgi:leader peptidase (prepilin peptidase)/N-methyltransferase
MRHARYLYALGGLAGFLAAVASIWMVSGASGLLGACLGLLMLAIAVTDFRYFIIPNELTAAALALAILNVVIVDPTSIVEGVAITALRGSTTMLFFFVIRSVYGYLRHQEGIGLGDIKLAFVAGAWLDWVMIPVAIEIAALVALMAYIVRQTVSRQPIKSTSRLPFGLFFAPSIWLSWLLSNVIFGPY